MFRYLFKLCTYFLCGIGRCFRFSYEKISVIFNLYLQGGVLVLTGVLPFFASCAAVIANPSLLNFATAIAMLGYATLYVTGFFLLLQRYPPRWFDSFDLCVKDLLKLCQLLHLSYMKLNLVIFVVWWIALIVVNLLLSYTLLP